MDSKYSNAATWDVPLGLQKLMALDRVTITQHNSWTTKNYDVSTQEGELLFKVKVDRGSVSSMCCGSGESARFLMELYDANNKLVISLRRPFELTALTVEVTLDGELVSIVRHEITLMKRVLRINDARDRPVLRIKGPTAISLDYKLELQTLDKKPIGTIARPWRGMSNEFIVRSEQFFITFPQDLDIRYKAATIGACLLIIMPEITSGGRRP